MNPAVPVPDDTTPPAVSGSSASTVRIETHLTLPRGSGDNPFAMPAIVPIEQAERIGSSPAGSSLVVPVVNVSADRLRDLAQSLLLANGVDDDRYQPQAPSENERGGSVNVAAVLIAAGQVIASVNGSPSRGRLQLDVMARWPEWPGDQPDGIPDRVDAAAALLDHCLSLTNHVPGSDRWQLELWGKPAQPWHELLAQRLSMASHRALHQLRCRLPVPSPAPALATRDLEAVSDLDAMLAVNNRAFASHPDQGGRDRAYLEAAFSRPGFDPADIRIAVDDAAGRMLGFCWTKLHPPAPNRPETAGEIYVVGIDPDYQGRGLGIPLAAAGLEHLHERGAALGMLYVESDNEPAIATYRRLGFNVHRTDRAWRHE